MRGKADFPQFCADTLKARSVSVPDGINASTGGGPSASASLMALETRGVGRDTKEVGDVAVSDAGCSDLGGGRRDLSSCAGGTPP